MGNAVKFIIDMEGFIKLRGGKSIFIGKGCVSM